MRNCNNDYTHKGNELLDHKIFTLKYYYVPISLKFSFVKLINFKKLIHAFKNSTCKKKRKPNENERKEEKKKKKEKRKKGRKEEEKEKERGRKKVTVNTVWK